MAELKKSREIVKMTPFNWGNKTKSGKLAKSGTVVDFDDGKKITYLTPSGKGTKYANEMAMNVKITNDGEFKHKGGKEVTLTNGARSYRAGYLDALKDNAKAYKARYKKNSPNKRTVK